MSLSFCFSRDGLKVPIINGKGLCSRIDPILEANSWVKNNESIFSWADRIVVVGLGAGFHITRLADIFRNKRIVVLEINQDLINHFQSSFETPNNVEIRLTKLQRDHFADLPEVDGRTVVVPFRAAFNESPNTYNALLISTLEGPKVKLNLALLSAYPNVSAEKNVKIHNLMGALLK